MTMRCEAAEQTRDGSLECPASAVRFNETAGVALEMELAKGDGKRTRLRVAANSGKPILGHSYWGNFAIDLDGLELGRQAKPILLDHDSQAIVGYTSKIEKTADGIVAEGEILAEDGEEFAAGRRVQALAERGFPWQASVYVPPLSVEYVPSDTFAEVNGHKLEGPGHIFRRSVLREVTVTSLGADENTDAELFGAGRKERIVTTKVTQTAPQQAEENPGEVQPTQLSVETSTGNPAASFTNDAVVIFNNDGKVERPRVTAEQFTVAQKAVAEERERVARLSAAAEPHQKALLGTLITEGAALADGLEQLLEDQRKVNADKLSALGSSAPDGVEFSDSSDDTATTDEGRERAKFRKSRELQHEFLNDEELYISFCLADGTLEGSN